ncbi:FtsX-like permease family protein [Kibdelosporangium lantanae]
MIGDLALGLRLAAGGSRSSGSSLLRLAMTTIGIALVVAVLLPAASITNVVSARSERVAAAAPVKAGPGDTNPLYLKRWYVHPGDKYVDVNSVAGGPGAPVPPGLAKVPAPGELVVSPAVADLLESPEGGPLRARLAGTVVGVIGKPGLGDASDLKVWAGAPVEQLRAESDVSVVSGFGGPPRSFKAGVTTIVILLPVSVALLLPLLVFVTTASRMGAAQRERRLAALRLIGLDARQIRRVAAAESLLGAVTGVVLGAVLFMLLRPTLSSLDLFGLRVFGEDFVPPWPLAVLVVLLVPVLAVGAALFGLRRTIIEPLGVVRQGRPTRRRMWWRWTVVGIGLALLALAYVSDNPSDGVMVALTAGSLFLLVGVAVVLPWLVERIANRLHGGPPSWQFAVARLQVDSGTASRVVSGIIVVLAGSIMIQVLLTSLNGKDKAEAQSSVALPPAPVVVGTDSQHQDDVVRRVRAAQGVTVVEPVRDVTAKQVGGKGFLMGEVGSCAALALRANIGPCHDGDVFYVDDGNPVPAGQFQLSTRDDKSTGPMWTIPANVRKVAASQAARYTGGNLLATPGSGVPTVDSFVSVYVNGTGTEQELSDRVAVAVSPLAWLAEVRQADFTKEIRDSTDALVAEFRAALLAASVFVLMVAALSLLILSVEQITERRRALAALSAAGVPLGVLARSSLWQTGLPVLIGIVLAVGAGLGLSAPVLHSARLTLDIDPGIILGLAGAALAAVLLVTGATLPLLRQVTRVESLRAE